MTVVGEDEKGALLNRLRRLEGQVRGLQRMLEDDRCCEDLITQVMAARSGIDQVGLLVLDQHLERCVLDGANLDEERRSELHAALRMWLRFSPVSQADPSVQ